LDINGPTHTIGKKIVVDVADAARIVHDATLLVAFSAPAGAQNLIMMDGTIGDSGSHLDSVPTGVGNQIVVHFYPYQLRLKPLLIVRTSEVDAFCSCVVDVIMVYVCIILRPHLPR
jgi:hypothetical protein